MAAAPILPFPARCFSLFTIDDFAGRMAAIRAEIQPRFAALGDRLAPTLSALAGVELFPHVAKHMRRTVNPPPETWVAFAADRRGYKRHPHLALCVSRGGLSARVQVREESMVRPAIARALVDESKSLARRLAGDTPLGRWDGVDPSVLPPPVRPSAELLEECARGLEKRPFKLDLGLAFPAGRGASEESLLAAWKRLLPLYTLADRVSR